MKIVNIVRPRVTDKDLPLKKIKHKKQKSLKKSLEISMSEAVTFFFFKIKYPVW